MKTPIAPTTDCYVRGVIRLSTAENESTICPMGPSSQPARLSAPWDLDHSCVLLWVLDTSQYGDAKQKEGKVDNTPPHTTCSIKNQTILNTNANTQKRKKHESNLNNVYGIVSTETAD